MTGHGTQSFLGLQPGDNTMFQPGSNIVLPAHPDWQPSDEVESLRVQTLIAFERIRLQQTRVDDGHQLHHVCFGNTAREHRQWCPRL